MIGCGQIYLGVIAELKSQVQILVQVTIFFSLKNIKNYYNCYIIGIFASSLTAKL